MTAGKILREARERKGYDLATVARRLRIRPDILRAIEADDFPSMPPRGYARNMVNAYARLLELNPTEIVELYLDEAYAYQVERARDSSPTRAFVMDRYTTRPTSAGRATNNGSEEPSSLTQAYGYGNLDGRDRTRNMTRRLYDDRTPYSRDDYGVTRERVERPDRSERDFLSHHSGYADGASSARRSRNSGTGGRTIRVGQTPMEYKAPRFPRMNQSRGVFIAAIALAVLLIIAVVFFITSNTHKTNDADVSQLPVSGISDTTGTSDGAESAQVEIAPTSARVVMTVTSGNDCYIETDHDGVTSAEMLSGPTEKTVEVTGTWTIATYTPDNIKVTVNGEQVQLTVNDKYAGMYTYTVDFPKLLEQWKATHTSKTSQRQAAVTEATNAAAQSKASSAAAAKTDSENADGNASTAQGTDNTANASTGYDANGNASSSQYANGYGYGENSNTTYGYNTSYGYDNNNGYGNGGYNTGTGNGYGYNAYGQQ